MIKATILISLIAASLSFNFLSVKSVSPVEFLEGWVSGTHLFGGIEPCQLKDPEVIADVEDILEKLKSIESIADVLPAIKSIIADLDDVYVRLQTIVPECEKTSEEVRAIVMRLVQYMKTTEYQEKLVYHTIANLNEILNKVNDLKNNFVDTTSRDNGVKVGELERFIFYWDFEITQFSEE